MFRGGFWLRFLFALLLVIALVGVGVGVYRMGFAQGYQAHALISEAPSTGQGSGSSGQVVPPAPYYGYGPWLYGPRFWGPGFGFFPFFPLFGFGFFLLMFFVIGGLFRFLIFRRFWGGPGPGYWHRHPYDEGGERPAGSGEGGEPGQEQK